MRVSSRQLWSLGPEALTGNSPWAGVIVRYSPLLIIAIAWELAARLPLLPACVLPPLSEVLEFLDTPCRQRRARHQRI